MTQDNFKKMSIADQGMLLMSEGTHLSQIQRGDFLLNLYSVQDFFVEVYYSRLSDKIVKMEIMTDLSRVDQYIEEKQNEEKMNLN